MSASSPVVRTHRIIGGAAILHAAIIGGIVIGMALQGWFPSSRLWVAFVTLWLVWPIALLVHRGRSIRRLAIPLLISLPLLWPAWRDYTLSAPAALGLPLGMSIYPRDLYAYFTAHRAGHAQAENDLRAGVLAVETYGFPMPPEYAQILRDRYHIELRSIAGDTDVTARVLGHAQGYNELSKAEVRRRFGGGVLEAAADESLKHWNEQASK
ncbi:MAG: hypothetical protein M3505_04535 [Verrucomicrobiota bacterium]|nr:hypothetical protein [Verrucomicrobiota bacterium]